MVNNMRIERAISLVETFQKYAANTYMNADRFRWTSAFISECLEYNMWVNKEYKKMPRWAQSEVSGYIKALSDRHWKLVEYSYLVDNKRVVIKTDEWYKADLDKVDTKTGCYVYKDLPTKYFTKPTKEQA